MLVEELKQLRFSHSKVHLAPDIDDIAEKSQVHRQSRRTKALLLSIYILLSLILWTCSGYLEYLNVRENIYINYVDLSQGFSIELGQLSFKFSQVTILTTIGKLLL